MDFVKDLRAKAKAAGKTIVLCEGEDKRVVEAASVIVKEGIAKIILLGNADEIAKFGFDMSGVKIVDPKTDSNADKYAEVLYKAREGKINKKTGLPEYADVAAAKAAALKDYTMYGALILKAGDADGFVSGACHSTANTLRPGLQVIKTAPGIKTVSSCFIMVAPEGSNKYLPNGISVFGDCAINIEPSAEELADIAVATAETAKKIAGIEPKVAMLSFSTKGSGNDAKGLNTVGKVVEATNLQKQKLQSLLSTVNSSLTLQLLRKLANLRLQEVQLQDTQTHLSSQISTQETLATKSLPAWVAGKQLDLYARDLQNLSTT